MYKATPQFQTDCLVSGRYRQKPDSVPEYGKEVYPLGVSQHTKSVQRLARQVEESITRSTGVIESSKENSQGNLEEELGAMHLVRVHVTPIYHVSTRFSRRIVASAESRLLTPSHTRKD